MIVSPVSIHFLTVDKSVSSTFADHIPLAFMLHECLKKITSWKRHLTSIYGTRD